MTDAALDRIGHVLTDYILPGSDTPYFTKVFKGDALSLTITRGRALAKYRYLRSQDAPESARNLKGDTMREDVFLIESFWPLTPMPEAREAQEDEIYAISKDLPEQFIQRTGNDPDYGTSVSIATYDQASKVSDSDFYKATETQFRSFRFELHLRVLGGS